MPSFFSLFLRAIKDLPALKTWFIGTPWQSVTPRTTIVFWTSSNSFFFSSLSSKLLKCAWITPSLTLKPVFLLSCLLLKANSPSCSLPPMREGKNRNPSLSLATFKLSRTLTTHKAPSLFLPTPVSVAKQRIGWHTHTEKEGERKMYKANPKPPVTASRTSGLTFAALHESGKTYFFLSVFLSFYQPALPSFFLSRRLIHISQGI